MYVYIYIHTHTHIHIPIFVGQMKQTWSQAPPTSTAPLLPAPSATPRDAASQAPQRRDRSPSPKKPKSGTELTIKYRD